MAQYTPHYGLHQWEPEDSFLREDFNQDLARIDTALAEIKSEADKKTFVVSGTYVGNRGTKTVELGFFPKAVLVVNGGNIVIASRNNGSSGLSITETGFQCVYSSDALIHINSNGQTYAYLALG